jgi:GNAT superfamily N-acetyltransferase
MILRPATIDDARAIAQVHVNCWRTTYRGILPHEVLDGLSYDEREEHWRDWFGGKHGQKFTFVAVDPADQIVGFASAGLERTGNPIYHGEIYAIYVLQSHQRQGLGRRLVEAVVGTLRNGAIDSMLVWVLAQNPACRFYECLGGRRIRTQQIDIGGVAFDEVAYGWNDLPGFCLTRPSQ